MLKHPSVSFYGPDRDKSAASNADNQGHSTDEGYTMFGDRSEANHSIQETPYQEEDSSGAPSAVSQVRRRAENRYIYELRRRLKNNNTTLAQGQDPFRFAGKETNCETPGPRKDRQGSLLRSIDFQIRLNDVEDALEVNDPPMATALQGFWRSSANATWSADQSDRHEKKLEERARNVQNLLDSHDRTSHNISAPPYNSLGENMRSEPESRQQSVLNSHSGGMTGSTIVPRACDDCRRQKKRCTHKSVTVENQNGTSNSPDEPFSVPQAAAYNAAAPQPTSVSDSGVFAGTATDQGTAANVTDSTFLPSTECAQPPSRSGLSTAPLAGQPQSRKRPADLSSMSRDGSSKSARLNEYPEQNTRRSGISDRAPRTSGDLHASGPAAFGVTSTLGYGASGLFQPAENSLLCYTCAQTGHTAEQHDQHTARYVKNGHSARSVNEYHVQSQVVIRLTLEGHEGTQLIVFSEKHDRAQFLEEVKKCFRTKDILSVTIKPNATYDLPKQRKIGVNEAGNAAWEMTRYELIALSHCLGQSYGSVEVNALVRYGG